MPIADFSTGLTNYWPLNGDVLDHVGSFNGTVNGSPAPTYATGQFGRLGLSLIAANSQYVNFGAVIAGAGKTAYSFGCWFTRTGITKRFAFTFDDGSNSANNKGMDCDVNAYGFLVGRNGTGSFEANIYDISQAPLAQSGAHHFLYVFDGSQGTAANRIAIYIDGTLSHLNSTNGTPPATVTLAQNLFLGRITSAGYSEGIFQEARLYGSRALSATDAAGLAAFVPKKLSEGRNHVGIGTGL